MRVKQKKQTIILQEKLVKKKPETEKRESDVARQQTGTRRQSARKTGLEVESADYNKRPKALRKSSSAGDCHDLICLMFFFCHSSTTIL